MFEFIFDTLAYLCHQIPDRCLSVAGVPLPICARCAGLHSGMAATLAVLAIKNRSLFIRPSIWGWFLILGAILLSLGEYAGTWFLKLMDGLPNYPRYILSLFSGAGIVMAILGILTLIQFKREVYEEQTKVAGVGTVLLVFAVCALLIVLPLIQTPVVWFIILSLYIIGALGYFGGFNYIPFAVGFRLMNYKPGARAYVLVGVGLAIMQLVEYLLLRVFYREYAELYNLIHNILTIR